MRSTLTFASVLLLTLLSACHGYPWVTLSQGTVRGSTMTSYHGRNISAYRRIPFAKPPVGDLRFRSPVEADAWEGVWDATEESPRCPQMEFDKFLGNEDCLYINVYTPQLEEQDETKLLPVMFYFFGGGFAINGNEVRSWGPGYLLDKDVIFAIPSYRLGAFGFLSTGDSEAPGNFGMKDIALALKWIQRNIKFFGGDPDNVTIFGNSSGSDGVHLLALSDLVSGLFHKFILQSGFAGPGPLQHINRTSYIEMAYKLGEHLDCPTNTSSALISCLRQQNASTIVNADSIFYMWHENPTRVWRPTEEPDLDGAFLTDTPQNLLAAGKMKDLPFIIGTNRDEGLGFSSLLYANETILESVMNDLDNALPYLLSYYNKVDNVPAFTSALKEYYLNDVTVNNSVLLSNLSKIEADLKCFYPAQHLMEQQLLLLQSPFYSYSMEYRGTFSYSYLLSGGIDGNWGVSHADEIIYLFPHSPQLFGGFNKTMSKTDMKIVDIMVQLWTSFATNGTPIVPNASGVDAWEPYSLHKTQLRIGSDSDTSLAMQPLPHQDRMRFWRELTEKFTTTSSGSVPLTPISMISSLVICAIYRITL